MKLLGVLVAAFAAVPALVGYFSGDHVLYVFAGFTFLAALAAFRADGISRFLRVLICLFSIETIVLGTLVCLGVLDRWPTMLEAVRVKAPIAMTVALFVIIAYVVSFIPVARRVLAITDRYFEAQTTLEIPLGFRRVTVRESTFAAGAFMIVVVLSQVQVFFRVSISFATSAMFNALQAYDQASFWSALLITLPVLLAPWIIVIFIEYVTGRTLVIRWRTWLTQSYTSHWLDAHNHYRMTLAGIGTDNPDQRISEDIAQFVDGAEFGEGSRLGVYNFAVTLIATLSSLVSYSIILWGLSKNLTIPGTHIAFPGLLLWYAIIYAIIGTALTAFIGRALPALAFARQHYEANFRFGLARLREYGEQIAQLKGEPTEKAILSDRFQSVIRNYFSIAFVRARLAAFTNFFGVISYFIPYIILAPFFFAKKIKLGDMTLSQSAFGSVSDALTYFVNYFTQLAEFRSVLDRLTTFDTSLRATSPAPDLGRSDQGADFVISDLSVDLPNKMPLLGPFSLQLDPKKNVLVSGPSGSGKSTFFRAISGVWPYKAGRIEVPAGATLMVLPQKPYLPSGTLHTAICYPESVSAYPIETVTKVLQDVGLGQLADELEVDAAWTQRLSGGEQQRLAIARAILKRPQWLFLDEATSAMDPELETSIYKLLAERLPDTTLVSIAHRETLADHHARQIKMRKVADGRYMPSQEALVPE